MYRIFFLIFAFGLLGCGPAYRSPTVVSGPNVEVILLSQASVARANRSPYQPRRLPSAFHTTAAAPADVAPTVPLPAAVVSAPQRPLSFGLRLPRDVDPGPYRIGVGDVVAITHPPAFDESGQPVNLSSREFTVQDDGAVTIPELGRVTLAGMSIDEAEAMLFQRFVDAQRDPSFGLEIAGFHAQKVTVGGAVVTAGVLPIKLNPLSLAEALATAGGIAPDIGDAGLIRLFRDGQLFQIPLSQFFSEPDLQNLRLLDGDSVYVDVANNLVQAEVYFEQQISISQAQQLARDVALRERSTEAALLREELAEQRTNFEARLASGAIARDYVYIFGEVGLQTRYPLPFEARATLADALFDAGNGLPLQTGDVSQIYVLRAGPTGTVAWRLDGRNAANFTLAPLFELRPNDLVFIAEQPITRWGRVVQQLTPSLVSAGAAVTAQN